MAVTLGVLVLAFSCGPTNSLGLVRGQDVTAFAIGARHVCARVADRTLRCFGDNSAGQLGDGTVVGPVDAGDDPPLVDGGGTGALDGGALDAGADPGSPEPEGAVTVAPRIVPGITMVAEVTAGFAHTCARLDDRTVRCWGANDFGQLGDATTISRPTQVILPALRDVRALSAGGAHTCAILQDRTVNCWGRNDDGQLGDGSNTMRPVPVPVAGLADVEQISAGMFHTCARLRDNSVRCWGRNDAGQIGDGTAGTPRPIPTPVVGLVAPIRSVVAGHSDTCALTTEGTVWCWGRANARPSPAPVVGFADVQQLVAGASATELHLCGLINDQSIRCTTALNVTPPLVRGIVNAVELGAGPYGACARLSDGAFRCWTSGTDPQSIIL